MARYPFGVDGSTWLTCILLLLVFVALCLQNGGIR